MVKIMYINSDGKIELTKEELEKFVNEAYQEGYKEGSSSSSTTIGGNYGRKWWDQIYYSTSSVPDYKVDISCNNNIGKEYNRL